jgi:A/G-specific adenine glycosylase
LIDKEKKFSHEIAIWYDLNQRDLPWRCTKKPYLIWLSEIILQQTRVAQGMDYFLKFQRNYPSIKDLATAKEDQILKDWQGLGYYSRARNLHHTAKYIHFELAGHFPTSFEEIKKLKGVGDYTAAAIASFAYQLPHAVVDGNVYRVLSRYFGIETPIDTSIGKKEFQKLANSVLDSTKPDVHNQSIMEFGALQCVPKNPDCANCPIQSSCYANEHNKATLLPIKQGKTRQRKRFFNYLIIEYKESVFIKKREGKGIWQNLFDFPLIESEQELQVKELINQADFKILFSDTKYNLNHVSETRKHVLSHQILMAKFYHLRISSESDQIENNYLKIDRVNFSKYAIPKLIDKYIREESNLLSLLH